MLGWMKIQSFSKLSTRTRNLVLRSLIHRDRFKLFLEVLRDAEDSLEMMNVQSPISVVLLRQLPGQRQRRRDYIADLPTVQLVLAAVLVDEFSDTLDILDTVRMKLFKEDSEDLLFLPLCQVIIPDCEVDTGLDGNIQRGDTIGGEDHDTMVVLKDAK